MNGSPTFTEIPGPVVQIGNNTYGAIGQEIKVTFTFQGDTSHVDAYSVPGASGYEIRMGTAAVLVQDSSNINNVLFQGAFDPTAGIFVSVDNTNSGIGFGSHAHRRRQAFRVCQFIRSDISFGSYRRVTPMI